MFHDESLDLTWADPPPKWVTSFGVLHDLWQNPIFQRRYVLRRLTPFFGLTRSFIIGAVLSVLLNIIMLKAGEGKEALESGFYLSVAVPAGLILVTVGARMFINCLVATPVEFRSELGANLLGPVLATPLSDSKIYHAECFAGLFRSLGAVEETGSMLAGLILGWIVIGSPVLIGLASQTGKIAIVYVLLILIGILALAIVLALPAIMASLAAGLYSIVTPLPATAAVTFAHVSLVWILSAWLGLWLAELATKGRLFAISEIAFFLVTAWVIHVAVMISVSYITARLGVMALARARRPGYYEPERSTAAGLFLKEERQSWHMGKPI
jgi:hypothetical protein